MAWRACSCCAQSASHTAARAASGSATGGAVPSDDEGSHCPSMLRPPAWPRRAPRSRCHVQWPWRLRGGSRPPGQRGMPGRSARPATARSWLNGAVSSSTARHRRLSSTIPLTRPAPTAPHRSSPQASARPSCQVIAGPAGSPSAPTVTRVGSIADSDQRDPLEPGSPQVQADVDGSAWSGHAGLPTSSASTLSPWLQAGSVQNGDWAIRCQTNDSSSPTRARLEPKMIPTAFSESVASE